MKLTIYDRMGIDGRAAKPKREVIGRRSYISQGHIRMFQQLRDEGYSWRQIDKICGVGMTTAYQAIRMVNAGLVYPEVTTKVLRCNRNLVGKPTGQARKA